MAEGFETGIDVADVYAAALFALATEAGTVDETLAELEELVRLLESDPGFAGFMTAASVDDDDREESLEQIFRGRLSDIVLNTLQVMNQHNRAGLLRQLLRAFVVRLEDARGQIEVTATSAVELSDPQKLEVRQIAEELAGRKPLVEYVVDSSLIGGLTLQIGDYRFDNSVRQHLRAARTRLLERSNRGLGIGLKADS